jgi:hypothetical protein
LSVQFFQQPYSAKTCMRGVPASSARWAIWGEHVLSPYGVQRLRRGMFRYGSE